MFRKHKKLVKSLLVILFSRFFFRWSIMSVESSSVCKDTNEVRDDKNLQTGQDVSNLLVQDEKLTSHLQMSALGNQQKEQILQQLDQLKRDLNKKFVPTEPVSEPDDLPDLENNQDSQKESNQEPQKEMSEGNFLLN